MALESTQPLTEMSTTSISWSKGGRCVRLTPYHHPVPLSRNLGTLTSWDHLGLSRPVMGLLFNSIYQPTHALLRVHWLVKTLNPELNPICHLLALLGTHPILHVSRIRVNILNTRQCVV